MSNEFSIIRKANLYYIAEAMGSEATEEDAAHMISLLIDAGYEGRNVGDVPEDEWLKLCEQAVREVAEERQTDADGETPHEEDKEFSMYTDLNKVSDEFRRVFGKAYVEEIGKNLLVTAKGWPEAIEYDSERAYSTLQKFDDGYGTTEDGDAEVCRALERSGAFIRRTSDE